MNFDEKIKTVPNFKKTAYQEMGDIEEDMYAIKLYPKSGKGDFVIYILRKIKPHTWKVIKRHAHPYRED